MPFVAPGNRHDDTAMMISNTKRVGISILLTFSMPLRTPCVTTIWVRKIKAKLQATGFMGWVLKAVK